MLWQELIRALRHERCSWAKVRTFSPSSQCHEPSSRLAAAVTNAGTSNCLQCPFPQVFTLCLGGIGVIGGVRQSPKFLKGSIEELKSHLEDKNAPFGVDLLIPQIGGSARKTNKGLLRPLVTCPSYPLLDYTGGQLPELIDVIIQGRPSFEAFRWF